MKIAFIVPEFPSLSQTFVLNQITGLVDCGHEITIFARSAQKTSKVHEDITKFNLLKKTFYYQEFEAQGPKNKFLRIIYGLALAIRYLPTRPRAVLQACNIFSYGRQALSFSLLWQIIPFFKHEQFDVVYCHFGPCGLFGLQLKKRHVFDGKLITVFHGYDMTSYVEKNGKNVYAELFAEGDLFLPISKYFKNILIRLGCPENKIHVHRMGIDVQKFQQGERSGSKSKINLHTTARLVEKKGVEFAIEAVAKVVHDFPEIKYSIAGDGPLSNHLADLIDKLGVRENIHLLGWQSQKEISKLMEQADILLAPSVTGSDGDMEGIPVVLMEACAVGVPVISTFHSGIPELIKDGVTGTLVEERNVDQLAEKLRWVIMHPETRLEMARTAHSFVMDHYEITMLNQNLITHFEELIDQKYPL